MTKETIRQTDIKGVIFDFFGVICDDPQRIWLDAHGLQREGLLAQASDQLDLGMIDYDEYIECLAGVAEIDAKIVQTQLSKYARVDTKMVDLIKKVSVSGYSTALLSNACSQEVVPHLEANDLSDVFKDVIISADVGMSKPSAKLFRLAAAQLGLNAPEIVFVDDSRVNVAAARDTGMVGVVHTDYQLTMRQLQSLF